MSYSYSWDFSIRFIDDYQRGLITLNQALDAAERKERTTLQE